ncbi:murein biosynthesis integral membrane protein MurJ [Roseobacter ponti]|uniref:Uncharacterized protein n=1 Tax=Roseobacter ponti TaxID=1891787 RepID=A0A858SX64_9RHOB|nr:lipid II flippase MurJ [Roseobacter ponti]QJF52870.1 hypothetical protein G3256_17675 [Roseobacter ponti]
MDDIRMPGRHGPLPGKDPMARSMLQASLLVSFALLLSRLSGLFREQALAARLGIGAQTDAVVVILTLPDLLTAILMSGGFSAALVPALARADPAVRVALLHRIAVFTLGVSAALAFGIFLSSGAVVSLLAPSLDPAGLPGFRAGFTLSLVAVPVAAVIGVSAAWLQAEGRAAVPGLAVLVFNGVLIVFLALLSGSGAISFTALAIALLIANLLRLGCMLIPMRNTFVRPAVQSRFESGFARQFAQGVLAVSLISLTPVIFRSLASLAGSGELAAYNFAMRLFDLPAGLLTAPVNILFLPLLSRLAGAQDSGFADHALMAIRCTFALTLSAAITCWFFSGEIAALVFGYGALAGGGTEAIAATLRIIIPGLPFLAVFQSCTTALNATRRTGTAFICAAVALPPAVGIWWLLDRGGLNSATAATSGFIAFQGFAALFALLKVGGVPFFVRALTALALIFLRAVPVALAAGALIWFTGAEPSVVMAIPAMGLLSLLLVAVNAPVIRDLATVRSHRSDVQSEGP